MKHWMMEKSSVKVVGNICVSIILLVLYGHLFGQHSLKRYLDRSVIITKHKEKQATITPPGENMN